MPGWAQEVHQQWDRVRAYAYALRVAWVATVSVLIGFLMFIFAPQAQDLFLEVRGSFRAGSSFWIVFYLAVLLAWALPVYVATRWLLWHCRADAQLHDDLRPVDEQTRRYVPAALAAGCLVSVAIGQTMALLNVPDILDPDEIQRQREASSEERATVCALGISLSCLIAVGRHFGAATLYHLDIGPEKMIVGLYGLLVCFGLWWLIGRTVKNWLASGVLRTTLRIGWWLVTMIGLPVMLVIVMIYFGLFWEEALKPYTLVHLAVLPGVSLLLAYGLWAILRPRAADGAGWLLTLASRLASPAPADREAWALSRLIGPAQIALALLGLLATFLLFFQDPVAIAGNVHRSLMVPFLLGPLVPVLTHLRYWSLQIRAPLVIGLMVVVGALSAIVGESHEMRTVEVPADTRRHDLSATVQHWAKANGCEQRPEDCPSPIIISAAGGASRAGFLVGGLIGKLIDERAVPLPTGTQSRPLLPFENQLFAISGVSGGSLGATMAYAALADRDSTSPPCKDGLWQKDTQWFRAVREQLPANLTPHESWRSCLELLLAGDFLSPVFVRMVGNDLVGIGSDRAVALEQAWEQRYREMTGRATLADSLIAVRNRAIAKGRWLPVLMLNGTSVATGRRIVSSDVDLLVHGQDRISAPISERMLVDAYDLHALLASREPPPGDAASAAAAPARTPPPAPAGIGGRDIALSTAATVSARFPIISPHGSIRGADGRIVDRVVDGGYYENFGASTALELARMLTRRYHLTPTVVLVNNEPTTLPMDCIDEGGLYAQAVKAPQRTWLSTLTSPLDAVANARRARGTYSAVELCTFVKSDTAKGSMAFITVKPTGNKPLSMSWWLSKHVQQYLDLHLSGEPGREPLTTREREFMQVNADALRIIEDRRSYPTER